MKKTLHPLTRLLMAAVLSCFSVVAFAQKITVSGIVTDTDGAPLVGATVIVMENARPEGGGTTTNSEGEFSLNAAKGQQLAVSYIGYQDATVEITSKTYYEIALQSDNEQIDEVVVVGYGTQKKVNVTGSVSTIDASTFDKRPVVSASVALQGMAPGVTVTTPSGAPGADSGSIRIRGINSFGGSSTAPLVLIDGIEGSLDSVDPSLIESISILKDAASSSIYGSRAANGVILVTTKRSSAERFSISYKGYVGWQSPTDLPETVNALEFRELTNAMNLQDGNDPTYDAETMELYRKNMGKDPDLYPNTDWQDAVLNGSGFTHSHLVSLGIGSERVRMLTSLGYVDQEGIIKTTDFKRYSFRNNADIKFNEKLSMKLDLSLSNSDRRASPYQGTIFNYMNTRPADIPNQYSTGLYNGLGMQGMNPVALMLEGGQNKTNTVRLTGAITLAYEPVEWLTLQGMLAPRYATTNRHNWKKPVTTYQDMEGTGTLTSASYATLTESGSRAFYGNYNFLMTFSKNFNGHDLKLILGTERNTYDYKYLSAYRQVFNYPDYDQINVGEIENMDNSGYQYQWAIQSYFGRINYNFKERYLLEANLRIDGSSRFSPDNRWANFYAFGLMWDMKKEAWLQDTDWMNDLRLKVTYGTTGNSEIGNYAYMGSVAANSNYNYNGQTGWIVGTVGNSDLTWESFDYYRKTTVDMLMDVPMSWTTGHSTVAANVGSLRNQGFEASFGVDIFNNNRIKWNVYGNVAYNRTIITKLYNGLNELTMADYGMKWQVGHDPNEQYAVKFAGVDPRDGEAMYYDLNGNITKEFSQEYMQLIGKSMVSPWSGGFGTSVSWKGLTVNADFSWIGERWMKDLDRLFTENPENVNSINMSTNMLTMWQEPGDVTSIPKASVARTYFGYTDMYLSNAAFLRLKNLTIAYDLPQHLLKKTKIVKGVRVFATGRNLLTFTSYTGLDPEVDSNGTRGEYPNPKQYTIGLEVKF